MIREEIEISEEAKAVIEEDKNRFADRLEHDVDDEDFGREEEIEEEHEEFEMDDGRRLEVEVREQAIEKERGSVEPEEGQQIPGTNEILEMCLEVEANVVEEMRRNEKK
jgi:hypothetical protein